MYTQGANVPVTGPKNKVPQIAKISLAYFHKISQHKMTSIFCNDDLIYKTVYFVRYNI